MTENVNSGVEMLALKARLDALEKTQTNSVFRVNNIINRLSRVEKLVMVNVASIAEFKAMLTKEAETRTANAAKLDSILDIMTHTKSVAAFVQKHGPRVLAFLVGGLVLSGKVTPDFAAKFLHLFGL